MKIALIHPASPNPAKNSLIWPPIGLCKLASFLKSRGHDAWIVQDALYRYSHEEVLRRVEGADLIGIGSLTVQAARAEELVLLLRKAKPGVEIVLGGPHFTAIPFISEGVSVVRGYGEGGLLRILAGESGIIESKEPPEFEPLSYDHIEYEKYGDHLIDGSRAISLMTSVGCPFDCRFCGSPGLFGRRVTSYPVDAVAKNMVELSKKHGINNIRIMDDTFTFSAVRISQFKKALSGSGLSFSCLTHVECLSELTLSLLKDMGMKYIAVGVESASDVVLTLANKKVDFNKMEKMIEFGVGLGLKFECLFMLGLPGDTVESMKKSIEYAQRLLNMGVFRTHFQYFTPFPGTRFCDEVKKGLHGRLLTEDWTKYNHRMPVFIPTGVSMDELCEMGQASFALDGRK
jgi:radical SAM superfamily enzyme YgiQ (UPF0313 family)